MMFDDRNQLGGKAMIDRLRVRYYRWLPEIAAAYSVASISFIYATVGFTSPLVWPTTAGCLMLTAAAVWVRYNDGYAEQTGSATDRSAGGDGE